MLGSLIAAIPFVFAALRAVSTGTDFRFVWVALASMLAAAIVLAPNRSGAAGSGRRLLAFIAATAAAAGAGFAQGAQSVPAVLFVALGFAACSVFGLSLLARRPQ
ncbi:MAG TPA: hypothetical protein VFX40_01940 [Gemmatimonadaceae bacterium]|nr:hypothetical protein [Gemmatimonadaceae bacterium]